MRVDFTGSSGAQERIFSSRLGLRGDSQDAGWVCRLQPLASLPFMRNALRVSYTGMSAQLHSSRWPCTRFLSTAAASSQAGSSKAVDAAHGITSALAEHLASPAVLKQLRTYGFCVIDRAFSGPAATGMASGAPAFADAAPPPAETPARSPSNQSPLSARLRQEVLQLANKGLMKPNHTHLVMGGGSSGEAAQRAFVAKQAILEADFAARPELLRAAQSAEQPALSENSRIFWNKLVGSAAPIEALNSQLSSGAGSSRPCTIASFTVKAQLNEGGSGCFPLHFDTSPSVDARKLTAVIYLNPTWQSAGTGVQAPALKAAQSVEQMAAVAPADSSNAARTSEPVSSDVAHPSDGGELRLYPFPHGAVDISPIDERVVLFDSHRMLHRVLPSARPRVCVSLWFSQDAQEGQAQKQQRAEDDARFAAQQEQALRSIWPNASAQSVIALQTLLSERLRVHWAKLFLRDAWFTSIEESHSDSVERQHLLVRHLDDTDQIERALQPLLKQVPAEATHASQPARHSDDDFRQPWQRVLPLPWSVPPQLPPFCSFVDQPAESHVAPAPAIKQEQPSRLVTWFD